MTPTERAAFGPPFPFALDVLSIDIRNAWSIITHNRRVVTRLPKRAGVPRACPPQIQVRGLFKTFVDRNRVDVSPRSSDERLPARHVDERERQTAVMICGPLRECVPFHEKPLGRLAKSFPVQLQNARTLDDVRMRRRNGVLFVVQFLLVQPDCARMPKLVRVDIINPVPHAPNRTYGAPNVPPLEKVDETLRLSFVGRACPHI